MEWIKAPLVCGIVFYFFHSFFKLIICRRERILRIQMREPANYSAAGGQPDRPDALHAPQKGRFNTLQASYLMLGLGIGLVIGLAVNLVLHYAARNDSDMDVSDYGSVAYTASMLICGGLGLLKAYRSEADRKDEAV